jgi:hypothetical protein
METSLVLNKIKKRTGGLVQTLSVGIEHGFVGIEDQFDFFECSLNEFLSQSQSLEEWQAQLLLAATFHRTLAYQTQIMDLISARELASEFIDSLEKPVEFYSNCVCDDDTSGIQSWNPVTKHTFESILYCKTKDANVLVLSIDED